MSTTVEESDIELSHGQNLDRMMHAAMGRATSGLSPASLIAAYMDWFAHLSMSPGKRQRLLEKAVRKYNRLLIYAQSAVGSGHKVPCIEPLPQDRRFAHPDWQRWPFNLLYQSFLLTQQWWYNATSRVRGQV